MKCFLDFHSCLQDFRKFNIFKVSVALYPNLISGKAGRNREQLFFQTSRQYKLIAILQASVMFVELVFIFILRKLM